jgi:hypothetical protein
MGNVMRVMLRFKIPVERGNAAAKDGSLGSAIEALLAARQPEAAYFHIEDGQRAGTVVFDVADVAELPQIAEPLFSSLNAAVSFEPVLTMDDLRRGLGALSA